MLLWIFFFEANGNAKSALEIPGYVKRVDCADTGPYYFSTNSVFPPILFYNQKACLINFYDNFYVQVFRIAEIIRA